MGAFTLPALLKKGIGQLGMDNPSSGGNLSVGYLPRSGPGMEMGGGYTGGNMAGPNPGPKFFPPSNERVAVGAGGERPLPGNTGFLPPPTNPGMGPVPPLAPPTNPLMGLPMPRPANPAPGWSGVGVGYSPRRPELVTNQQPNFRAGRSITGGARPGQTPRSRSLRGGGIGMF
jgi:hypothetical protein